MRKIVFSLALASLLMTPALALADDGKRGGGFQTSSTQAESAQAAPGGFIGSGAPSITVSEALKLGDDAWVTLTGRIEKQIGHEKYQFSDGTGAITLDIDDDDWHGLTVGPGEMVEIQGEVDKDFMKTESEVERIVKK